MKHEFIEQNMGYMVALIILVISIGGLVEIVPLLQSKSVVDPSPGVRPLTALELEGRDIYIREGCHTCHTQMIRTLPAEVIRYGTHSRSGEHVYEHPFLWGSKRTGPDLARVGARYSDEWHDQHLYDPRSLVPKSVMPSYPWLRENLIKSEKTPKKLAAFKKLGVPYSAEDIQSAQAAVEGQTEMTALIAYLQQLGTHLKGQ